MKKSARAMLHARPIAAPVAVNAQQRVSATYIGRERIGGVDRWTAAPTRRSSAVTSASFLWLVPDAIEARPRLPRAGSETA